MSHFIQLGTGRFLRGFIGPQIKELQSQASIESKLISGVAVQSTGRDRSDLLKRGPEFLVHVRGLSDGVPIEVEEYVRPYHSGLSASDEWGTVLELAVDPELHWIISNTTESGFDLLPEDVSFDITRAPKSLPAKLAHILLLRRKASMNSIAILPCELIENNADVLLSRVLKQTEIWGWNDDPGWVDWVKWKGAAWYNTVVDRIVTLSNQDHNDLLAVQAEPYSHWAIAKIGGWGSCSSEDLIDPLFKINGNHRVDSIHSWSLRKLRILNAAHTLLVEQWRRNGRKERFVREMLESKSISDWIMDTLMNEVCPTLESSVEGPAEYIQQTLERFRNPFLDHKLSDIEIGHQKKISSRISPTILAFERQFGAKPRLICSLFNLN
jgi:tagaturonate reductase